MARHIVLTNELLNIRYHRRVRLFAYIVVPSWVPAITGMTTMIKGSCHCNIVRYQIDGEFFKFQLCHCNSCQKFSGGAFGTSAITRANGFKITHGNDSVTHYESPPGKRRCFCSKCGSHIYAYYEKNSDIVIIRIGTVDGDPGIRPSRHIWVGNKAPWYDICDDLPQLAEQ